MTPAANTDKPRPMLVSLFATALAADPAPRHADPTFSWSLAYRARHEFRLNPSLEVEPTLEEGEPADLIFVGSRLRANFSLDSGHFRVATTIQDGRRFGTEASTAADEATLDMHQGYLEVHDLAKGGFDAKIGRFELAWGSERLIGPSPWTDVGRSFDGFRTQARFSKQLSLDVFGAWVRERRTISVRDQVGNTVYDVTDGDGVLGTFAVWKPVEKHEIDLYVLGRFDGPTTTPRQLERLRRIASPGARATGSIGGFEYSGEGSIQFGQADGLCEDPCVIPTSDTNDHFAWAYATSVRYTIGVPWKPFLGLAADGASGDGDPNDGDSEEFDNFFPSNHGKYGAMDLIGWRNMSDEHATIGVSPLAGLVVSADVHVLGLQQEAGTWWDAAGNRMDDGLYDLYYATSRSLGTEGDLGVVWRKPGTPIKASAGVSRFWPGPAAEERKGPDPSWWGFLSVEVELGGSTASLAPVAPAPGPV